MNRVMFIALMTLVASDVSAEVPAPLWRVELASGQSVELNELNFAPPAITGVASDGKMWSSPLSSLLTIESIRQRSTLFAKGSQVLFATGDILAGKVLATEAESVRLQSDHLGEMKLPLTALSGVIIDDSMRGQVIGRLLTLLRWKDRIGDQLILRNGDIVSGTFIAIDENEVRLEPANGDEVAVKRELVAAIAFDPTLVVIPKNDELVFLTQFRDGSSLRILRLTGGLGGTLTGDLGQGESVKIDGSEVVRVTVLNGDAIYLASESSTPWEETYVPFFDLALPARRNAAVDGGPIQLGDQVYRQGIGVSSGSRLVFPLDAFGSVERFEAKVGLDARSGALGSARFIVRGDDRELFATKEMTVQTPSQFIQVPLSGVKRLELAVEFGRRADIQDRADWADARLIRKSPVNSSQ